MMKIYWFFKHVQYKKKKNCSHEKIPNIHNNINKYKLKRKMLRKQKRMSKEIEFDFIYVIHYFCIFIV